MKATRVFQITALLLVIVSVVLVGSWLVDQHDYTLAKVRQARSLYAQQVATARELQEAGIEPKRIHALLPDIVLGANGPGLDPKISRDLAGERARRINRYVWESGFFLFALGACIAVIWRALHAESRARQEQDSFLALVSHQFKTPLASLQLSLETIALRPLSAEQSRSLSDRMLADIARMENMVTQILDSMRLASGRVQLKQEAVDLAGAMARVVGQFAERAQNESVALIADVPAGMQVLADPLALDAVMRNLIENAFAAVAPGGGGRIALTARRLNDEVEVVVRDSGVGFKSSDRARLFRKFSRLHPGGGSTYYGTGLGLFIVRRLMQLAGGRVTAHSDGVGQGAAFVLVWPASRASLP